MTENLKILCHFLYAFLIIYSPDVAGAVELPFSKSYPFGRMISPVTSLGSVTASVIKSPFLSQEDSQNRNDNNIQGRDKTSLPGGGILDI